MTRQLKPRAPLGVILISLTYAFGAIILLVSRFTNSVEVGGTIAERHALSPEAGPWVLSVLTVLALAISYGLYSLSRWGYWLTIAYLLYFGAANLVINAAGASIGNVIWSLVLIVYLALVRRRFFNPALPSPAPAR